MIPTYYQEVGNGFGVYDISIHVITLGGEGPRTVPSFMWREAIIISILRYLFIGSFINVINTCLLSTYHMSFW